MKQRKTKHLRFVLQRTHDLITHNGDKLEENKKGSEIWKRRYIKSTKKVNQLLRQKKNHIIELENSRLCFHYVQKCRVQVIKQIYTTQIFGSRKGIE